MQEMTFDQLTEAIVTTGDRENEENQARKPYLKYLEDYGHINVVDERKKDFLNPDYISLGYKIHLNAPPEHVNPISEFLISNNFVHKYLKGADAASGKIFTVFLGSKTAATAGIKLISTAVGHLLSKPLAKGEALYAPNMVGRFVGSKQYYATKITFEGFTIPSNLTRLQIPKEDIVRLAKAKLEEDYGDYFGGGIEYWEPKKDGVISSLDKFFRGTLTK